ncbi:MAG: hypothetical protein PHG66_00090 [Candidatus Colwellbacteria bacterium]|nr:hypothetical protein [Candidatus Colwellbacteria bacterium]
MSAAIFQLITGEGKLEGAYANCITEYPDVTAWPNIGSVEIINKIIIKADRMPRQIDLYGKTHNVGKHCNGWYYIDAHCPFQPHSCEPIQLRGQSTIWIDATYTQSRTPVLGSFTKESRPVTELEENLPEILTHVTWGDDECELKTYGITLLNLRGDSKRAVEYMYGREYHLGNCLCTGRIDRFEVEL